MEKPSDLCRGQGWYKLLSRVGHWSAELISDLGPFSAVHGGEFCPPVEAISRHSGDPDE